MRHYLWTFVVLMLVISSGCSKPIEPIKFKIKFLNFCPGNRLQLDIKYTFSYLSLDPKDPSIYIIQEYEGELGPEDHLFIKELTDGADRNGDGALDYGNLDSTPPDTDSLCIKLDYLDADPDPEKMWNDIWVASANTIVDGCTVEVTIDENCLASYEIKYPASDGISGSSTESGVFRRVDRTLLQDIDEDSSR